MVILGLDMAGHNTGVALTQVPERYGETYKILRLKALHYEDWVDMALSIISTIEHVNQEWQGSEVRIAIEDTYYDLAKKNPYTVKMLNRIGGAVIIHCVEMRYPYKVITIAEIDTLCGIQYRKGGRKAATMQFAKRLYDGVILQDEADAVCVAFAAERLWYREDVND